MEEFMIVDISSIISLLTKIDPIKAFSLKVRRLFIVYVF